jgi:hypothetical protein
MSKEISRLLTQIADHERRIALLEGKAPTKASKKTAAFVSGDYSGPTGGVRYLISRAFLKEKRDLAAMREQLASEGYHYSRQAIHEALKTLSKASGPLVSLKEGARKIYVERK